MIIVRFSFTHKTASMFGHKALQMISQSRGLKYFSPNNTPPNHTELSGYNSDRQELVLMGPSRSYSVSPMLRDKVKSGHELWDVCQIRNPLDIIVSQYFSHGWIHPEEKWSDEAKHIRLQLQSGKISMFEYALLELEGKTHFAGLSIIEKFRALEEPYPGTHREIVTYEEFYDNFDAWAARVDRALPNLLDAEALLLQLRPEYKNNVVLADDVFYSDPLSYVKTHGVGRGKHIRSAAPKDYLHFLTAEEITKLSGLIFASSPTLKAAYSKEI